VKDDPLRSLLHVPTDARMVVRSGRVALVAFDGEFALFESMQGLHDLARLFQAEGSSVHTMDLYGASGGDRGPAPHMVLDREAVTNIRDVVDALREEGRVSEAEEAERFVKPYVGYPEAKRFSDVRKRARVAVQKRIRAALMYVKAYVPALWEHLGADGIFSRERHPGRPLSLGTWCIYRPEKPGRWSVRW